MVLGGLYFSLSVCVWWGLGGDTPLPAAKLFVARTALVDGGLDLDRTSPPSL